MRSIRGCSFFTLHTRSDDFCPGYETFSGFSHRARNIFQIPLPGYETFLPKIIFRGTKHFCHQQFGGLLGILESIIISMEEFIGVIGILGSSIRSLEELRGVLGILASNYLRLGGV